MEIFISNMHMHDIPVHRIVRWRSQYLGVYEFSPFELATRPARLLHPEGLVAMWRLGKPSDSVSKAIRKTKQPRFEVAVSLTRNVFLA